MRIDTHRHLGGSIPVEWVWNTIKERGWYYLAESYDDVKKVMTFCDNEPRNFHRFLDKFRILDKIEWDEELISSSIKAVCSEIEKDKLDYVWLDFSINKYMDAMNWCKKEAIKFIKSAFDTYAPGKVGLILSLKYESMVASQRQYAKLIDDTELVDLLFGIDLVGDEAYFDSSFYRPIFEEWNRAGKMTRAHVAESQSALNGLRAITVLKVTNIAHGIMMSDHDYMLGIAKDYDVTFDLGITSNYLTGVWSDPHFHPVVKLLADGLRVTLGTDDPVQCNSTLDLEFSVAEKMSITEDQQRIMKKVAEENTKFYLRR